LGVKSAGALDKTQDVVSALDALCARLGSDDRDAVEKATTLIQELKSLVTTLDGQLAAMKWLAQRQFRPKTEKLELTRFDGQSLYAASRSDFKFNRSSNSIGLT
jgi:hypothetical protein